MRLPPAPNKPEVAGAIDAVPCNTAPIGVAAVPNAAPLSPPIKAGPPRAIAKGNNLVASPS